MAHILIVEDDATIAQMLTIYFGGLGHQTEVCHNGKTALARVEASPPDIIFSDIVMAPMDGIEFVTRLRAKKIAIPVIILSASTDKTTVHHAKKAGADDFLTKPLRLDQVRRCLDRVLTAPFAEAPRATVAASPAKASASRDISPKLAQFFPGDFYAPCREKLALTVARPRALIEAQPGMLSNELLECLYEASLQDGQTLSIRHLQRNALDESVAGLLDPAGELGPWFNDEQGILILIQIERLPLAIQRYLNTALRKTPRKRLLVTTAEDPDKLLAEGRFDEGLYFRFATSLLRLPPVREAGAHLIDLFLSAVANTPGCIYEKKQLTLDDDAAQALQAYTWPDNVAELRKVAAWTAGRFREPLITLKQLPEIFFKIRMPTLEEALVTAQTEHVLRARRIHATTHAAADALAIAPEAVELIVSGSSQPLFTINRQDVTAAQPQAAILLIVSDPVWHAATAVSLPVKGLRISIADHGLAACAHLAAQPGVHETALLIGDDPLFSSEELTAQLKRIQPALRLGIMQADTAPRTLTDVENAIAQLLLPPADFSGSPVSTSVSHLITRKTPAPSPCSPPPVRPGSPQTAPPHTPPCGA